MEKHKKLCQEYDTIVNEHQDMRYEIYDLRLCSRKFRNLSIRIKACFSILIRAVLLARSSLAASVILQTPRARTK